MNIIFLDAEFAENEELLELSVFNTDGKEVYHSFYKPEHISDWRTDIHHITPEMVTNEKPFSSAKDDVQLLLDNSWAISGFAVDNDLRVLTRSGIKGLENKRVIDVRDMYWLLMGKKEGMSPFAVPSLIICANSMGISFDENIAHSASVDTEFSMMCFNHLLLEYKKTTVAPMNDGENIISQLIDDIKLAKAKYVEEGAKGYIRVLNHADGYKIKYVGLHHEEKASLVLEVEVKDRYKAEYEIRKLMKKREIPGKHGLYRLTEKDVGTIKKYENTYDAEESAWCKKIVRNLSRISL